MPNGEKAKRGLTGRENWPSYALGIVTEAAFILGLTLLALLMAVLGKVIWQ